MARAVRYSRIGSAGAFFSRAIYSSITSLRRNSRSPILVIAIAGALGYASFRCWKADRRALAATSAALLTVQLCCTLLLGPRAARQFIIFAGDGGCLVGTAVRNQEDNMDASVSRIADYASTLAYGDLPAQVVHECKRRIIDTVGCALGAFDEEPSRIARALAARSEVPGGARVLGTGQRSLPELATFANGVMARYFDGNDVFPGGGGHPSDVIPAVLAAVDVTSSDGPKAITGIVLAYEIYGGLFRAACMRDRGLDSVFYTAVASAVGAARVLGLDRENCLARRSPSTAGTLQVAFRRGGRNRAKLEF